MGKPKRIKSPEQMAAERVAKRAQELEAVNIPADAASLRHGEDIEVTRQGQKRGDQKADQDGARRLDAFEALKVGMVQGAYDAARRYEHQMLVRRGENDRGPASQRVDRAAGFTTDAMIDAGRWLDAVDERLPPRDWWLLRELICPTRDHGGWRGTVSFITGEGHTHAQGAAVRALAVNLRDASLSADKWLADLDRKAAA